MARQRKGAEQDEERQGEMRPLGQTLSHLLRPLLKDRPAAEAGLIADWPDIAGAELAALCRPLKVRFDKPAERRQGVLELACDGPAALELQHRSPELLQRVNAYLGYPAIERLRLRQRPVPAGPGRARRPRQR